MCTSIIITIKPKKVPLCHSNCNVLIGYSFYTSASQHKSVENPAGVFTIECTVSWAMVFKSFAPDENNALE